MTITGCSVQYAANSHITGPVVLITVLIGFKPAEVCEDKHLTGPANSLLPGTQHNCSLQWYISVCLTDNRLSLSVEQLSPHVHTHDHNR